ncbi:MAG TPA: hypothetical protein VH413_10690 [Verrucomicrobiae bacterium]|nr:hypothetical protein [Verrucomicrobiae bacterium]
MFIGIACVQSAFGQESVSVGFNSPGPNSYVTNSFPISVGTTSTYELQGVQIVYDGQTNDLSFNGLLWVGTLSFTNVPFGNVTLTAIATDVFGVSGQKTETVIHDNPPTLSVTLPVNGTVARPGLDISAISADDGPAGSHLSIYVESAAEDTGGPLLVSATNSLTTNSSLAAYDGELRYLRFEARDSANQYLWQFHQFYVQSSTNFVEVAKVSEGIIVDVNSDRLLFFENEPGGGYLKVYSRTNGAESVVNTNLEVFGGGFLAPEGAVSVLNSTVRLDQAPFTGQTPQVYSTGQSESLSSQGNYAAWALGRSGGYYPTLGLINLTTGASQVITNLGDGPSAAFQFDVAANGDVVYSTEDSSLHGTAIYRYRSGTSTLLASDGNTVDTPKTDGTNVFYIETTSTNQMLVLLNGAGKSVVAQAASIGADYLVRNGWVAYEQTGGGQAQIWRRAPNGVTTQITFFGTSSTLAALNPLGEIFFYNGSELYFGKVGTQPAAIATQSPGLGLYFYWLDGRWYGALGRSLFQVYTGVPSIALPHISSNMFNLDLVGAVGQRIVTQTSVNGSTWTDILTNQIADGTNMTVQLPMDTNSPARFYRIHSQ